MESRIAIKPRDGSDEHECCSICGGGDIVLVIEGGNPSRGTNCYYCGNTIVLCRSHAQQMISELEPIKHALFSMDDEEAPIYLSKEQMKKLQHEKNCTMRNMMDKLLDQ